MFLDYLFKACILFAGIYLWDFVFVRLKEDYDVEVHNVRIAEKDFGLQLNIRYSGIEITDLIWNFTKRTLKIEHLDFLIKYSKLKKVFSLEDIKVHFGIRCFDFDLDLKNAYEGKLTIKGKEKVLGTIRLGYKCENDTLYFKKQSGSLSLPSIEYKLHENSPLTLVLTEEYFGMDAKNLSMHAVLGDGVVKIEGFINTPLIHGHGMIKIGKKNRVKFNLKTLSLIKLIEKLASDDGESDSFGLFKIHGYAEKIEFQNKEKLFQCTLKSDISSAGIQNLDMHANYKDGKNLRITCEKPNILLVTSESASNTLKLFIPEFITGGTLAGQINLVDMNWHFAIKDIKFPTLAKIQVKHFMSPMRWIRLLFSDPSYISEVSASGTLADSLNYIGIDQIHGGNSYYDVLIKGFIDFRHSNLDIKGSISSSGIFRKNSPENSGKDITFYVMGNLEKPDFKYNIAPWTVISTIFQPFMY